MRALEEVVQRAVLDHAVQEFGLVVSDEEVRAAIARNPAFQGTGGAFDPLLYRNRLQQARISEAQYVTEIRREIAANQLFGAVRPDGLAPKSLRDDIFKMEGESGSPRRCTCPTPSSPTCPSPRPSSSTPISRPTRPSSDPRVPRLLLRAAERRGHPAPGVGDGRAAQAGIEARSAEFGTPEKRDVDQAMADTEAKAKAIIADTIAGKSLRTRPRKCSATPTA